MQIFKERGHTVDYKVGLPKDEVRIVGLEKHHLATHVPWPEESGAYVWLAVNILSPSHLDHPIRRLIHDAACGCRP